MLDLNLLLVAIAAGGATITTIFTAYTFIRAWRMEKAMMAGITSDKKSKAGQKGGEVRRQRSINKMLGEGMLEALDSTLWMLEQVPWLKGMVGKLRDNPDHVLPTLNSLMRSPFLKPEWKEKIQNTLHAFLGSDETDGEVEDQSIMRWLK